jgi:hypothetical protein
MLTRCSLTGTFTGTTWAGTEANGHSLDVDAVLFLRLEDGFVIEMDEICDSAVVADQLGFRPGDRSRVARLRRGLGRFRGRRSAAH